MLAMSMIHKQWRFQWKKIQKYVSNVGYVTPIQANTIQYKQEVEFVIILIEKHFITFIQTTTSFSRNLLQGSIVFE